MKIHYPGTPEADAGGPTLRLDQLEAIYRIKREITTGSMAVLVGAGMGSGKTVVSSEVILKTAPARCLVVGVRDAYKQWEKTYHEQGGTQPFRRIDATVPGQANLKSLLSGDDGLFYIGLEMLRSKDWEEVSETIQINDDIKAFFGDAIEDEFVVKKSTQLHTYTNMKPLDLLISDESHKHSNQASASLGTVRSIPTRAKIALSGTFFNNQFINAWSCAVWLWGKPVIGSKAAFETRFCVKEPIMSKDGKVQLKSKRGFPLSKIMGEKNPGEFVETLPCYVFIATPIGPVPEPEVVLINLGKEQERQYREMVTQSLTWVPNSITSVRAPLIADIALTQRNRLRTAALGGMTLVPSPKEGVSDKIRFDPGCKSSTLDEAYRVLHRPTWAGKKALILTHSAEFAIEAARRIGQKYPTALKAGKVPSKRWEEQKERFMLPPEHPNSIQYLVAVISAVGTATDGLQANCAKVLWLSEDDSNVNNIQGSNRVWRDGVKLEDYEAVKIVQRNTIAEGVLMKNDAHRADVLDSVAGNK